MNHPPPHMVNGRPGVLPPSPPHSLTKSSNGSGPYSLSGGSDGRKYPTPMLEEQLQEHHRALRAYLLAASRDEQEEHQPHHRARDKLLRLSIVQFQELSTDVYDELLRRENERRIPPSASEANFPRFLLPKPTFHPKRNQARQKLATLAIRKFRELAADVLFELERRHPQFAAVDFGRMRSPSGSNPPSMRSRARSGSRSSPISNPGLPPHIQGLRRPSNPTSPLPPYSPVSPTIYENGARHSPGSFPGNEYGRPLPRGFQGTIESMGVGNNEQTCIGRASSDYGGERGTARSSQRTTNKGLPFAVEEHPLVPELQTQISQLEEMVAGLEIQLRQKDAEIEQSHEREKQREKTLQEERTKSSNLTTNLATQLKSAEDLNGSLQSELASVRASNSRLTKEVRELDTSNEWKTRYENLERDFVEQQQVTEEVRQEASRNLQEMRELAERSSQATDHEEHLTLRISQLELAVKDWKNRFTKAKAQLRNLRALSTPFQADQPSARLLAQDASFTDPSGLVKDISVTQYQIAVEELLQISRGGDPSAVLDYMRTIVSSVRAITEDVDAGSVATSPDEVVAKRRTKLKARVSGAANSLITAAKNYSAGGGLSPVSLVDAAAGSLTAAVVELVRDVKVRQTPAGELGDTDSVNLDREGGEGGRREPEWF